MIFRFNIKLLFIFLLFVDVLGNSKAVTQAVTALLVSHQNIFGATHDALIVCYGILYKLYENPLWAIVMQYF
jgi:hypothetical protein